MRYLILFLFLTATLASSAQNLPNKQDKSVWLPSNAKIDGLTTEWDNKFKAYNHATNLFYTVANDDKQLYFTFRTDDPDALTKITTVGIRLTITPADGKPINISYPFYEGTARPYLTFKPLPKQMPEQMDSIARSRTKKLEFNQKYIRTAGMEGVDTVLSVYNEIGIKTQQAFDNAGFYTCEIAIPLKYLNLAKNKPGFDYTVTVPGVDIRKDFGYTRTRNADGMMVVTVAGGDGIPSKEHLPAITSTTDFSASYTLATKPN